MTPISTLAIVAGMGLTAVPGSSAFDVIHEALSEKADMPALRPILPSLLAERDRAVSDQGDRGGVSRAARVEGQKAAGTSAAAAAHAANASRAAARDAAREAARADADKHSAAEKSRAEKTKLDKKNAPNKPGDPDKKPGDPDKKPEKPEKPEKPDKPKDLKR